MKRLFGNSKTDISLIKDPFKSDKVESITLNMYKPWTKKDPIWYGRVCFKNDNTSGEYKTKEYKVDEFELLLNEIRTLIDTL